jgi:hypothetical protein
MERTEAVEYRRFRVIEIWELQDDLVAGRLLVPFVHMSGLPAADMHKLDLEEAFWPQKVRRRFAINSTCERTIVDRVLDKKGVIDPTRPAYQVCSGYINEFAKRAEVYVRDSKEPG